MSQLNPGLSHRDRGGEAIQAGRLSLSSLWKPCSPGSTRTTKGCTPSPRFYGNDALALAEAAHKAIRAGHAVGPWHGVPIALKDIIDIEGRVTTVGSKHWENRISPTTATLARRLNRGRDDRHRQGQHRGIRHGRLGHQSAHGDAA